MLRQNKKRAKKRSPAQACYISRSGKHRGILTYSHLWQITDVIKHKANSVKILGIWGPVHVEYFLVCWTMCPHFASIDDFGSISPMSNGFRQARPTHWVSMYAQLQPGRALMPYSQPLSMHTHLVYTAQGQHIRGASSKEADMPARRWIYSTNKSAHHGGFSGGLHLLGHTCAHRHMQQRYINTCASCPKDSVSTSIHITCNESAHMCTRTHAGKSIT